MNRPLPTVPFLRSLPTFLGATVGLGILAVSALAEPPQSLLPAFGTRGGEIEPKALEGYDIRGWLPKDWIDNSSWAPVSAVYHQLQDAPAPGVGAVRIEVTKRDGFQVQLSTKGGARIYLQSTTYVVTGWVRSPLQTAVFVGFRENKAPKNYYDGKELAADAEWKRFRFEWTPEKDCAAWLIFSVRKVGMVDLAGIALEAKL